MFRSPPWLWVIALLAAGFALFVLELLRESWIARKVEALSGAGSISGECAPGPAPAEGGRPRLYMIGDSSISRWPPGLIDAHWEVVNCGLGGETTAHLERRIDNFDFVRPQDMVLIGAGGNDLVAATFLDAREAETIVEKTSERLFCMARGVSARGGLALLATIVPPSRPSLARLPVWRASIRDFVAEANGRIRSGEKNGKIQIVDFAAALESNDRRTPDIFRADTLHLNAAGYDRLAKALNSALDRALPPP